MEVMETIPEGRKTPLGDLDAMCRSRGVFGFPPDSPELHTGGDYIGFPLSPSPIAWLDNLDNSETEIDDGKVDQSKGEGKQKKVLYEIERCFLIARPPPNAPKKTRKKSKQNDSIARKKIKKEPPAPVAVVETKVEQIAPQPNIEKIVDPTNTEEGLPPEPEISSADKEIHSFDEAIPAIKEIEPLTISEATTAEKEIDAPVTSEALIVETEEIQMPLQNDSLEKNTSPVANRFNVTQCDSPQKSDVPLAQRLKTPLKRELKISLRKEPWDRATEISKGIKAEQSHDSPKETEMDDCSEDAAAESVVSSPSLDTDAAALDPKLQPRLVLTPLSHVENPENTIDEPMKSPVAEERKEEESQLPDPSALLAPFRFKWKRELYFMQGRVNVVYIHPLGLRLKDMEDVSQHLTDGLTLKNFSFVPEHLGADESQEVTIPEPKIEPILIPKEEVNDDLPFATSPAVRKSGRKPVPSSSYKLQDKQDTNSRKSATPTTKRMVLKIKYHTTPENSEASIIPVSPVETSRNGRYSKAPTKANTWFKKTLKRTKKLTKKSPSSIGNCTLTCPSAMGRVPSLQCSSCLCLHHPECVDVTPFGHQPNSFLCKNCGGVTELKAPAPAPSPAPVEAPVTAAAPPPVTSPKEGAPFPYPFPAPPAIPQFFVTLPGNRKFICVPNSTLPLELPLPEVPALPDVKKPIMMRKEKPRMKRKKSDASLSPFGDDISKMMRKKSAVSLKPVKPLDDAISSFSAILHVIKYLPIHDRLQVAQVCRFLRLMCMEPSLWEKLKITSHIRNWDDFAVSMTKHGTKVLDLTKMPTEYTDEQWQLIGSVLNTVPSLDAFLLPSITASSCRALMRCSGVKKFQCCIGQCTVPSSDSFALVAEENTYLEEVKIKCSEVGLINALQFSPLQGSLRKISLLNFDWTNANVDSLKDLVNLTELEFGEFASVPANFASCLLFLKNLERVRLEVCNETSPLVDIMLNLTSLPRTCELLFDKVDSKVSKAELESALANLSLWRIEHSFLSEKLAVNPSRYYIVRQQLN